MALVLATLLGCGPDAHDPAARPGTDTMGLAPGHPAVAPRRPVVAAVKVLREWDHRRAAAYASGDARRLRALYARGSWAGARDVRTLRSYADRRLVVDRLDVQVLRAQLLRRGGQVLRLRVLDRVITTVTHPRGSVTTLPVGVPAVRVVTMVKPQDRWVVRSVRRP